MCFNIAYNTYKTLSHFAGSQPRYVDGYPTDEVFALAAKQGWQVVVCEKHSYLGKKGITFTFMLRGKKTGRITGCGRLFGDSKTYMDAWPYGRVKLAEPRKTTMTTEGQPLFKLFKGLGLINKR